MVTCRVSAWLTGQNPNNVDAVVVVARVTRVILRGIFMAFVLFVLLTGKLVSFTLFYLS
jgi:hypothetical protein